MACQGPSRCLRCDYRLHILAPSLPPEKWLPFTQESVDSVPELAGVYQLLDADKAVLAIKGVINIRQALEEAVGANDQASFFVFEEDEMSTKRSEERRV